MYNTKCWILLFNKVLRTRLLGKWKKKRTKVHIFKWLLLFLFHILRNVSNRREHAPNLILKREYERSSASGGLEENRYYYWDLEFSPSWLIDSDRSVEAFRASFSAHCKSGKLRFGSLEAVSVPISLRNAGANDWDVYFMKKLSWRFPSSKQAKRNLNV